MLVYLAPLPLFAAVARSPPNGQHRKHVVHCVYFFAAAAAAAAHIPQNQIGREREKKEQCTGWTEIEKILLLILLLVALCY